MRMAAIGIGSNSVRLLVADASANGTITPVLRDRCGTRLFAGLEEGALSEESMEVSSSASRELERKAREAGAGKIYIFATSAVRDAKNGAAFAERIRSMTGLTLDVCTGEREALLSYAGAAKPGLCGMIDIGGGSTELTVGRDGEAMAAVSLQMGAVRLSRRQRIVGCDDFYAVIELAQGILRQGAGAIFHCPRPHTWVGVGGTFTTLGAMDRGISSFDRALVEGHALTREIVLSWGERLAPMRVEERKRLPGLQPQRADIVVHGIAILAACMDALSIDSIVVSDHGNLDGYLRKKWDEHQLA